MIEVTSESIRKAQKEELFFEEIYTNPDLPVGENEFLFFIKPEITLPSATIRLTDILELVYKEIMSFGLGIHNIITLSAKYMAQYNIIAQHYGVINHIATNARKYMSEGARSTFRSAYGMDIDDTKVFGGLEFLDAYPDFNAHSLGLLWQNTAFTKLAGGTYAVKVDIGDEEMYIINGFHPLQLEHFTEKGRSIVAMTLSGDLPWHVARRDFIGSTDPSHAEKGSLRRVFFDDQASLGLPKISASANGVHLSAGPVEALVELKRYNSDFSKPSQIKTFNEFSFGKKLMEVFDDETIGQITNNINLHVNGKTVSVFDLTEELDSDEALRLLPQYFKTE